MAHFEGRIVVEYINGNTWLLLEPFVFVSDMAGRIEVPADFSTDFNSVPRLFWRLIPKTEFGQAAVIHDWLWRMEKADLRIANLVFREALETLGAPKWRVRAMFWAVEISRQFKE